MFITTARQMLESLVDKFNSKFLELSRGELQNILVLSLSMLRVQTVCLNKLKGIVGQITGNENTKPSSNYQRLLRIFRLHAFSRLWLDLLRFSFQLLRLKCNYLALDGTSWKRGEVWHHYLVLSLIYKGVAIPIYWIDLGKQGISNIGERKHLMKQVFKSFNLEGKTLIADRDRADFRDIGIDWFKYLLTNNLYFVIRIKKNIYHNAINKAKGKTVREMIAKVKRSKIPYKSVQKSFEIDGMELTFTVSKNPDKNAKEEIMMLISNRKDGAIKIASIYKIRWKIEHCFKQLKSNGFDLEAMNVKGKAKQNLMFAIVVFTYVLSVLEGLKDYKKIAVKTYSDGTTSKAVSVFRNGVDKIVIQANSLQKFFKYILRQFKQAQMAFHSAILLNVQ
jgi:hypothetical protein